MKFEVNKVYIGFVVNVFNAVNYDIDIFNGEPENDTDYHGVYTFDDGEGIISRGKTYRCRMYGVLKRRGSGRNDEANRVMNIIKHIINKTNGWVMVKYFGRDKFDRILVELYNPINGECFNEVVRNYNNIYFPYSDKSENENTYSRKYNAFKKPYIPSKYVILKREESY